MSSSITNKEKRDGWKNRIFNFVMKNAENGHSSNTREIIQFSTDKIELGETVTREIIGELVNENKISYVEAFNNEKHYFPYDRPLLSESTLLQRNLIVILEVIDKQLDWMEKSYLTLKTIEEKSASIRHTLGMIFRNINRLVVLQALTNPESDSYRDVFVNYRKRIHRLWQIINAEKTDESRIMISWFYYLIENIPYDFKAFIEPF